MIPRYITCVLIFSFLILGPGCRTDSSTSSETATISAPEVIRARLRAEPDGLFPYNTSKSWSLQVARYIFPTIVDFNKETLQLEPVLCKTLPVITPINEGPFSGGSKITYEFLDEAKWDNGTPVTGLDYVFTMKAIFNPKAQGLLKLYQGVFAFIKKVEVDPDNPKRFSIFTKESNIKNVEYTGSFVVPEYNYDPGGLLKNFKLDNFLNKELAKNIEDKDEALSTFASQIVSPEYALVPEKISGCGPYKITSWESSERIILEKKKNWWGDDLQNERPNLKAFPKSLSYVFVPDNNAAIALLKNGELDVLGTIEGNSFGDLKENETISASYDFFSPQTDFVNYLGINNSLPKFSDVRIRKALSYLMDREAICNTVYNGYAKPVFSVIPNSNKYYLPFETKYDLSKANELLEAAGWKDGNGDGIREKNINGKVEELRMKVTMTPNNVISQGVVKIFKESCKRAGLEIVEDPREGREYIAARNRGDFELWAGAMAPPPGLYEPYQMWHTESPGNYFKTGSGNLDEIINQIITNQDTEKFESLYHSFQQEISNLQPVVFMVNSLERIVVKKGYEEKMISQISPGYFLNYFR